MTSSRLDQTKRISTIFGTAQMGAWKQANKDFFGLGTGELSKSTSTRLKARRNAIQCNAKGGKPLSTWTRLKRAS